MRCTTTAGTLLSAGADAVVIPVFADGTLPGPVRSAADLPAGLPAIAGRFGLAAAGDSCWVPAVADGPDLLLVCVGPASGGEAAPGGLRTAAMVAGRAARRRKVVCALAAARPGDPQAAAVVSEGWLVGSYAFDAYRTTSPRPAGEELVVWAAGAEQAQADQDQTEQDQTEQALAEQVRTGQVYGAAVNDARDLVNTPPGDLVPLDLAARCQDLASRHGLRVRVLQGQELADGGFGGLLGVGAGSAHPPVLIELERGRPDLPHVALVGKGITFDSGGLSLKSTREMLTMKADMSGAAAIIGALIALEGLGSPTHVRAYLACAENMPGQHAIRVGDVLRHRNGLTTEVTDTDCEGRLVLGDALAYAAEARPAEIIDIATLSSSTGLGPDLWAVLGTAPRLVAGLLRAGVDGGEPGWELPVWDAYAGHLRSDVADLRNYDLSIVTPFGAVLAALYLRRFAGTVPWAHIDLALTVMRAESTAAWSAGANGNGTRTLARYLAGWQAGGSDSSS